MTILNSIDSKSQLRKYYLAERKKLSLQERQKKQDHFLKQLASIDFPKIEGILSYFPMSEKAEIDPSFAIKFFQDKNPALWREEKFEFNNYVLPLYSCNSKAEQIDLIITPLLIADQKGFRLGYGKGYYDQLFLKLPQKTIRLGFCFFEPILQLQKDPWDLPLDILITDTQILFF